MPRLPQPTPPPAAGTPPRAAPGSTTSPTAAPSSRDRLIAAMTQALRRKGLHGIGLTELLAEAQAPKGVLYHHFPGGKTELAVAAIDAVVERMGKSLQRLLAEGADPTEGLRRWSAAAGARLQDSGFQAGCPLATVALESTTQDTELRLALSRAFAALRGHIAQALVASGESPPRAEALAALAIAAYEGGLLQARVAQDPQPLAQAVDALLTLMGRSKPA
jgi:TetR/AcrR family transcriptional repressor of lmrAB and yxaGH operons